MGLTPCSAATMIYTQFYLINMKYLKRCYHGWIPYLNGQRDQSELSAETLQTSKIENFGTIVNNF